jgi:hypothetical protein
MNEQSRPQPSSDQPACESVSALLPWHLNGSLDESEATVVALHLESCAACRQELELTRLAAQQWSVHPSADQLFELATGELASDARADSNDLDLVRRHAAGCPTCSEELESIRQAEGLAAPPVAAPTWPRRVEAQRPLAAWRGLALAASLVAVMLAAALIQQLARSPTAESLALYELLPSEQRLRSTSDTRPRELAVPQGERLVLLLVPGRRATEETTYRVLCRRKTGNASSGELLATIGPLRANELGSVAVSLPVEMLPESAAVTLELQAGEASGAEVDGEWVTVGTYEFALRRGAAATPARE